jgi:hypothetical protein
MSDHAPGPWRASLPASNDPDDLGPRDILLRDSTGSRIGAVFGGPTAAADARLICAAPDLLAVVESLAYHFPDLPELIGGQSRPTAVKLIAAAQWALAKAKGT